MYKIRIQYTNLFKSYGMETIFQSWKRSKKKLVDFTQNRTWPTFYDYIPVYKVWIQYTNLFKRYHTENIFLSWKFSKLKKGHNSQNNWWILPLIELDLHFMIIYLCIKFQSNALIFSKDISQKPFVLHTGLIGRRDGMDVWTAVILYAPPPHPPPPNWKQRGHKNTQDYHNYPKYLDTGTTNQI